MWRLALALARSEPSSPPGEDPANLEIDFSGNMSRHRFLLVTFSPKAQANDFSKFSRNVEYFEQSSE